MKYWRSRLSLLFFLGTIASSLLISSCNKRPGNADLIFLNGAEPQSLDPGLVTGQLEGRLCNALFEGLTTRGMDGVIGPGVAEKWETSEDGKVYTFILRKNAKWSNGSPVTAYDFEQSWKRVLEPETASKYAEIMFFIKNAEEFNQGKLTDFSQVGVKALNASKLRVTLKAPAAYFPDLAAFTTYLPVHIPTLKKYGAEWIKPEYMVSNGAYRLKDWKINDRVELEKNPHYWRKDSVHLNRIDALATSQASTAFNLYATGQADLILDKSLVPATLLSELKKRDDFHSYTYLATYFLRFNVTLDQLKDSRIRQALSMSVDKETIVTKITQAGESPASSLTPPGIPGYEPPKGLSYDPEKAKKLLAEAGYPNGNGFPRTTLLYRKSELSKQIAVEIQAMWKKNLNLEIELRNQEWATYLRSLDTLDYHIATSGWIGDYPDPNTFLDCFVSGRGNNRTGWSHAEYDQLLLKANIATNPEKRFHLMKQAEKILVEQELPITPVYFYVGIVFFDQNRLRGFKPNLIADHPLRFLHWKENKE